MPTSWLVAFVVAVHILCGCRGVPDTLQLLRSDPVASMTLSSALLTTILEPDHGSGRYRSIALFYTPVEGASFQDLFTEASSFAEMHGWIADDHGPLYFKATKVIEENTLRLRISVSTIGGQRMIVKLRYRLGDGLALAVVHILRELKRLLSRQKRNGATL